MGRLEREDCICTDLMRFEPLARGVVLSRRKRIVCASCAEFHSDP